MVKKRCKRDDPNRIKNKSPFLKVLTDSRYLALWVSFVLLMVLTLFPAGPI
jgi:hypothetical protein